MSEDNPLITWNAKEEADSHMRLLKQYFNLESVLQDAYDQGVANTIESEYGTGDLFA